MLLRIINAIKIFLDTTGGFIDKSLAPLAQQLIDSIIDISDFSKAGHALLLTGESVVESGTYTYRALWESVEKIYQMIEPVGYALVTTFFLIQVIGMASQDNSTLEHYIKEFVKLIVAITIINKGWDIIILIVRLGDQLLSQMSSADFSFSEAIGDSEDGTGFGRLLGFLIPWLIKKIAVVALYVAVYMRALDIAWRTALFPVGVANMFDGGVNSPGVKYIKSYAGSVLSGVVMLMIIEFSPAFLVACFKVGAGNEDGSSSGAKGMLAMAAGELGFIGAVFGAGNKVKEIFN